MSDSYQELLDATIQHLQSLKERGVRFVPASAATLTALSSTPRRTAPARPSSARAVPVSPPESAQPSTPITPAPATVASTASPTDPVDSAKAAAIAELRTRVLACVKCPNLVASRNSVVFGVGNINAEIMFVGEAPGADEDLKGEPFVGKAGQLLTKIIQTMGLTRDMVYIANILKCRPDTPGQATGNRPPTGEEMSTCVPYLHEQIEIIRPRVLVALGGTALGGLLGKTAGITRLRGNWQTYRGVPLMPTYHPAYLLHNDSLTHKRHVWEDMLQVMEKLGMPITEKQRGFFLKAG